MPYPTARMTEQAADQVDRYAREMGLEPVPAFDPVELTEQRQAQQQEQQRQEWISYHRDQASLHARFADQAEARQQVHLGIALDHQQKADRLEGR